MLSPSQRQVAHALLTRPPLTFFRSKLQNQFVRLECVKHAASVHPEPGSNSRIKYFTVLGTAIYLFELDSLFLLFSLGITIRNWIVCTSLEFNELFGSSFDVPCFVFSSFVVQFSRYRLLPLFATAYLVYHTQFRLSRGFLNFFQVSFRHFRPLKVTVSCSFSLSPCLPCLSGTGSLAELYYITTFFSFCQPLFTLFSPFFLFFYPFFSTFRAFYPFFLGFLGFCGFLSEGMAAVRRFEACKTSELPAQETGLFFSLVRKEPKVHQRSADLWTPGTVQNSMEKYFSWHFLHSSLNRYMVRRAFSDVLNRCERVIVVQTQDWCFSKAGCRTTSSLRRMYPKRVAARYLCWVRIQNCCALFDRFNG